MLKLNGMALTSASVAANQREILYSHIASENQQIVSLIPNTLAKLFLGSAAVAIVVFLVICYPLGLTYHTSIPSSP